MHGPSPHLKFLWGDHHPGPPQVSARESEFKNVDTGADEGATTRHTWRSLQRLDSRAHIPTAASAFGGI